MKTTMKRIALVCMSFIMMFVACVNTYAITYMSSPDYTNMWSNYGTYVEVNTDTDPYATAHITFSGKTYDIFVLLYATVYIPGQINNYAMFEETKTLEETNIHNRPQSFLRRVVSISTDEINIPDSGVLMHTLGYSFALISDFETDEDGEYITDFCASEAHYIHSEQHDEDLCLICLEELN